MRGSRAPGGRRERCELTYWLRSASVHAPVVPYATQHGARRRIETMLFRHAFNVWKIC